MPFTMSPAWISTERMTWAAIGTATTLALFVAFKQLESFKNLAVVKDSEYAKVGVEKSTEDAIKLRTLEALATSVNPGLREAALEIIIDRALRKGSLAVICNRMLSDSVYERLQGVMALSVIAQRRKTHRLLVYPRVFRALIRCLEKNFEEAKTPIGRDVEQTALAIVERLLMVPAARDHLMAAGYATFRRTQGVRDGVADVEAEEEEGENEDDDEDDEESEEEEDEEENGRDVLGLGSDEAEAIDLLTLTGTADAQLFQGLNQEQREEIIANLNDLRRRTTQPRE